MSERGSVLPLLALGLALVLVAGLFLVGLAGAAVERAKAQTAADAAALAGAVEGRQAAAELARRNGGELVELRVAGDETIVRVRVGETVAEARAAVELGAVPPPGAAQP